MIWNIIAKYDASKNPPNMFRFLGSIAYTVQTLGYWDRFTICLSIVCLQRTWAVGERVTIWEIHSHHMIGDGCGSIGCENQEAQLLLNQLALRYETSDAGRSANANRNHSY